MPRDYLKSTRLDRERRLLAFQYQRAKIERGKAIASGDWEHAYRYCLDMLTARRLRRERVRP